MITVNLLHCPHCDRVGVQISGHDPRIWVPGTGDPEAVGTHMHRPDVDRVFPGVTVALSALWTVLPRVATPDRVHIVRDQLIRLEGDAMGGAPMALQDHERWGRLNALGVKVARLTGSLASKRYRHEGGSEAARIWGEYTKLIRGE